MWFGVFVLVVFLTGLGTGVLLDRTLGAPGPLRWDYWLAPGAPGFAVARRPFPPNVFLRGLPIPDRIADELGLSAEQRRQLVEVLERRRERLAGEQERFVGEARKWFEEEQRSLRAELEQILTPEQLKRFDERFIIRERGRGRFGPPAPRGPRGF